jgi:polyhydroxyalkanoate synthesis regulator phasin
MKPEEFKKLCADYAEAKVITEACKKRIEEIAPVIKAKMLDESIDKMESDSGNFTLKYVPVWTYSPAVKELEEQVDKLKETEKADGTATNVIRNDLMFKKS